MKSENVTNWVTWVNRIAVFLVSLLAIGAFALSYNALYGVASSHGIPGSLAYVWPLLIDGAIVVFSISVVRASLLRERAWWPWLLVIVFTAGTVFFNILHFVSINRPLLVSITIAIIAPVGLVLAFETVMGMLKSNVARRELVQSIAQIEQEMKRRAGELDRLQRERLAEIEAEANRLSQQAEANRLELANRLGQLESEIGQLQEQVEVKARTLESYLQDIEAKKQELKGLSGGLPKTYLPVNLTLEQKQDLANQMTKDGLTNEQIKDALGVSLASVKNYKKANRTIKPLEEVVTESGYTRNGNHGAAVGKVGEG